MQKRLFKIALSLFAGLVITWIGACAWLLIAGPSWITKKIKTVYPHPVTIGRTSTNFINTLRLHDITFEGPQAGSIALAEITIRWRGPQITLTKLNLTVDLKNPSASQPSVPSLPVPIDVADSKISVLTTKGDFVFENVQGTLRDRLNHLSVALSGDAKEWGTIESDVTLKKTTPLLWTVDASAKSLSLAPLDNVLGKEVLPGRFSGRVEAHLHAEATNNWTLEAKTKILQWHPEQHETAVPISGELTLTPATLTIKSLKFDRSVLVSGAVTDPFKAMGLKLNVRAENWPLSHLSYVIPKAKRLPITGNASFDLLVDGSKTAPQLQGNFSVDPNFGTVELPIVAGQIAYKDNKTNVLADFAKGKISLQQSAAADNKTYLVVLQDVALNAIAQENGWKNVHGKLTTHLSAHIDENGPEMKGGFTIDNLQWGRTKKQTVTRGELMISQAGVSIGTEDGTLELKSEHTDDEIRLAVFHADFGEGATVSARGVFDKAQKKLNFAIDGRNIPPDIWPPLVSRYPDIEGRMDFSGTVTGTSAHPSFNMTTDFREIRFIPTGGTWNGRSPVVWSGGELQMNGIHVEGGYEGKLALSKKGADSWLSADMQFIDADPKLLFDLFKSTLESGGHLTGEANIQSDGKNFVGASSTVWTNGRIGRFAFENLDSQVRLDKSIVTIDSLSLVHDAGTVRGSGTVNLRDQFAKYDLGLQLQQVGTGKVKFDGELNASGVVSTKDGSGRGRFVSPLLSINDYAMENVRIQAENYNNMFQLTATAEQGVALEIKANRRRRTLRGDLTANNIDLNKTISRIFPNVPDDALPSGPCNLSAFIEGPWDDPIIHTKMSIAKGIWRDEPLSSSVVFDINKSSVTVKGAEVKLERGGTIFLRGLFPFSSEKSASMTGAGSAMNLQSVMNLMRWPLKWEGETDATFSMLGAGSDRKILITFDGKHRGFGPVKEGGKLTGTAQWQNNEWNLSNARVDTGDGFLRLRDGSVLFIDRNKSGRMRMVADVRNVHTGLLTYFGRVEVTGSWEGESQIDGSKPPIELEVFARSLWINQYVLDGNVTHLTIESKRLKFSPIIGSDQQLSGTLDYGAYPDLVVHNLKLVDDGVEQFFLDGHVGPHQWDFKLHTKKTDASVVRGLFDTTLPLSGPMETKLIGKGSIDDPQISASVIWRDGKIGTLPLDEATCSLRLKDGILDITNLQIERKKGYELKGDIRLGTTLPGGENITPRIKLRLTKGNMLLLESLAPGINRAKGSFEGELYMDTVKGEQVLEGFLIANSVSFHSNSYIPYLRRGELEIRFKDDALKIQKAKAQLGKGIVNSTGTIRFDNGEVASYDVRLFTGERGVSIRIPELAISPGAVLGRFKALKTKLAGVSHGDPRFDLKLTGPESSPVLAGTIWLDNTTFTYPPTAVQRSGEGNVASSWFRDFYRNLNFDLTLLAGRRTQFENDLVTAGVSGRVKITGPTQAPDVRGIINSEQGSIVYAGAEFKLREATLEIVPESDVVGSNQRLSTLVYLRVNAERDIFYTDISGNNLADTIFMDIDRALLGEIQPRFRSKNNPSLPSNRALQLALGIPLTESLEENLPQNFNNQPTQSHTDVNQMLRLGVIQLLDSNIASPLARKLASSTGLIDTIRITVGDDKDTHVPAASTSAVPDTAPGAASTQNSWLRQFKGTRVKLGRGLTSRLFADYSLKVDEYQNEVDFRHEVELAYRLHRNLFIRATSELDSEESLGRSPDRRALLENRWRFGLPRRQKTAVAQP